VGFSPFSPPGCALGCDEKLKNITFCWSFILAIKLTPDTLLADISNCPTNESFWEVQALSLATSDNKRANHRIIAASYRLLTVSYAKHCRQKQHAIKISNHFSKIFFNLDYIAFY